MADVLHYIFSSPWTFLGTVGLFLVAASAIMTAALSLSAIIIAAKD